MTNDREVVAVLDALIDLLEEYELPRWVAALESDRRLVMAGDPFAYDWIRSRFGAKGLDDVWIALGDKHLNAVLDALRNRLRDLVTPEPEPEPEIRELAPAAFGERVAVDEPPPFSLRAQDYLRGKIIVGDGGQLFRSTWTVLDYDAELRFRLVVRMWMPCEVVSIEEYRSIRFATAGWWITLGTVLPVAIVLYATGVVRHEAFGVLLSVMLALLCVAALKVDEMERRSSAVVALYSEKTGEWVTPKSRGSDAAANDVDEVEGPLLESGGAGLT